MKPYSITFWAKNMISHCFTSGPTAVFSLVFNTSFHEITVDQHRRSCVKDLNNGNSYESICPAPITVVYPLSC